MGDVVQTNSKTEDTAALPPATPNSQLPDPAPNHAPLKDADPYASLHMPDIEPMTSCDESARQNIFKRAYNWIKDAYRKNLSLGKETLGPLLVAFGVSTVTASALEGFTLNSLAAAALIPIPSMVAYYVPVFYKMARRDREDFLDEDGRISRKRTGIKILEYANFMIVQELCATSLRIASMAYLMEQYDMSKPLANVISFLSICSIWTFCAFPLLRQAAKDISGHFRKGVKDHLGG